LVDSLKDVSVQLNEISFNYYPYENTVLNAIDSSMQQALVLLMKGVKQNILQLSDILIEAVNGLTAAVNNIDGTEIINLQSQVTSLQSQADTSTNTLSTFATRMYNPLSQPWIMLTRAHNFSVPLIVNTNIFTFNTNSIPGITALTSSRLLMRLSATVNFTGNSTQITTNYKFSSVVGAPFFTPLLSTNGVNVVDNVNNSFLSQVASVSHEFLWEIAGTFTATLQMAVVNGGPGSLSSMIVDCLEILCSGPIS